MYVVASECRKTFFLIKVAFDWLNKENIIYLIGDKIFIGLN